MKKLLTLLLICLTFSCNEIEEIQTQKSISIGEVQDLVNESKIKTQGRINGNNILWDHSSYIDISIGDALLFPIEAADVYVSTEDGIVRKPLSRSLYALSYKVNGEVKLELVQPVSTVSGEMFTGYYLVSEWGGKVKRYLAFEDGIFVGEHPVADSNNSNGRSNSLFCYETTYWECTETSVGGEVLSTSCDNSGSNVICILDTPFINDEEPIEPIDYPRGNGNGGSGSSSGGQDTELCPHPFAPEILAPCDEDVCADGYISDGEGGCIELYDIFNDLNDSCLKGVVNTILADDLKTHLTLAVKEIFDENGFSVNITFQDNVGTLPRPATHRITQFSPYGVTIYMDPNQLKNSSKQYISSVILHEIMHGYISYNDLDKDQLAQHFQMAHEYLNWMSGTMKVLFPSLTDKQASALSIRGLLDLFENEPSYTSQLLEDINISSLQEAIDLTESFKSGESGEKC